MATTPCVRIGHDFFTGADARPEQSLGAEALDLCPTFRLF
jgi:hypothetical protein